MAAIRQVESAWKQLSEVFDTDDLTPVTYINSAAASKRSADGMAALFARAATQRPCWSGRLHNERGVSFSHTNTWEGTHTLKMGISNAEMPIWNPTKKKLGGNTGRCYPKSRESFCGRDIVRASDVPSKPRSLFRMNHPGIQILVHPECLRK